MSRLRTVCDSSCRHAVLAHGARQRPPGADCGDQARKRRWEAAHYLGACNRDGARAELLDERRRPLKPLARLVARGDVFDHTVISKISLIRFIRSPFGLVLSRAVEVRGAVDAEERVSGFSAVSAVSAAAIASMSPSGSKASRRSLPSERIHVCLLISAL